LDRSEEGITGFTLVELLVVIGIIALLISILLPALGKARLQARRTQDLSNIRQIAVACVAYAAENKGQYPLGNRMGPNLANPPSDNDDLAWINSYTFGYFLQFLCNEATSKSWMGSPISPVVAGKMIDPSTQRRFACTSMYDSPDGGSLLSSVGTLGYQYSSLQTDPNGACYCETYMGFIYWGCRAQELQGAVYNQAGVLSQPATAFSFPIKQGQRSTSTTLVSCPAYTSDPYGCFWPHSGTRDSFIQYPSGKMTTPGNGSNSDPSSRMQGICCAYTDGSARWVPRKQLWSVYEGSSVSASGSVVLSGAYEWTYFDGSQR